MNGNLSPSRNNFTRNGAVINNKTDYLSVNEKARIDEGAQSFDRRKSSRVQLVPMLNEEQIFHNKEAIDAMRSIGSGQIDSDS